jgi:hypothetical protein
MDTLKSLIVGVLALVCLGAIVTVGFLCMPYTVWLIAVVSFLVVAVGLGDTLRG